MSIQYQYIHTCGHTGKGPIIPTFSPCQHSPNQPTTPPDLDLVPISFPIPCPFCSPSSTNLPSTLQSQGLLAIFSPPPSLSWTIIRSCALSDLTPADWIWTTQPSPEYGFRFMAWIPRPCGEVHIVGNREGRVLATELSCGWRQRNRGREGIESRFEGMLSQLNAALLSGQRAGRMNAVGGFWGLLDGE